jgi:hypothetical protein
MPALVSTSRAEWLRCEELRERCEELRERWAALRVFLDDAPRARLELFLARAEVFDEAFLLREPFEEARPRLVARPVFCRSLATGMFNLPHSGSPA